MTLKTLVCFAMITATSFSADAAEIRLRSELRCQDALVRLGDLADVSGADPSQAAALARTVLFPAPSKAKTLRLSELEELLALASVDVTGCRFSGASAVTIHPVTAAENTPIPAKTNGLSKAAVARARTIVERAVANRLQSATGAQAPWEIKLTFDERHAASIVAKGTELTVAGGREPWTGEQEFAATLKSPAGQVRFNVAAQISLPPMVIVAIRPMRKGEVVRAADVELQPAAKEVQNAVYRVEEVVGKETNRAVATGQVLEAAYVRSPVLVQRGEAVKVIAKAAGVRVRTTGRALQEGSLGELVEVQPLDSKQRYTARVVDYQEVEVYAQGPSVNK